MSGYGMGGYVGSGEDSRRIRQVANHLGQISAAIWAAALMSLSRDVNRKQQEDREREKEKFEKLRKEREEDAAKNGFKQFAKSTTDVSCCVGGCESATLVHLKPVTLQLAPWAALARCPLLDSWIEEESFSRYTPGVFPNKTSTLEGGVVVAAMAACRPKPRLRGGLAPWKVHKTPFCPAPRGRERVNSYS